MVFERNLNIRRGDVGRTPVTLLLCFQVPDPIQLYHSQFSIAWRVINFTGEGHEDTGATYINQHVLRHNYILHKILSVINPQITVGNRIKPNQWIEIEPGQKTTLETKGSGVGFTKPTESGCDQLIIAKNDTETPTNFGIGFVDGDKSIPILHFPHIAQGCSLGIEFKPIVQAYVVSGYQETALLRGAIEFEAPFLIQDLTNLPQSTDWIFEKVGKTYSLKRLGDVL